MNTQGLVIVNDGATGVYVDQHGYGTFEQLVTYILNDPPKDGYGTIPRQAPIWHMAITCSVMLNWMNEVATHQERQTFAQYIPRALVPSPPGDEARQLELVLQCAEELMSAAGAAARGWYEEAYAKLKEARKTSDVYERLGELRGFYRALLVSRHGETVRVARDPFLLEEIRPYLEQALPPEPSSFDSKHEERLAELLRLQALHR